MIFSNCYFQEIEYKNCFLLVLRRGCSSSSPQKLWGRNGKNQQKRSRPSVHHVQPKYVLVPPVASWATVDRFRPADSERDPKTANVDYASPPRPRRRRICSIILALYDLAEYFFDLSCCSFLFRFVCTPITAMSHEKEREIPPCLTMPQKEFTTHLEPKDHSPSHHEVWGSGWRVIRLPGLAPRRPSRRRTLGKEGLGKKGLEVLMISPYQLISVEVSPILGEKVRRKRRGRTGNGTNQPNNDRTL